MLLHLLGAGKEVFWERLFPLVVARASHAILHPGEWGALELVVLGLISQIGLELYRHGVPYAFASAQHLPARGRPLEVLATRDKLCIGFSNVAIVVMMFHYLQFMAISPNVLWRPEQVRARACVGVLATAARDC